MTRYVARVLGPLSNGLRVGIFRVDGASESQVGEYTQVSPALQRTFFHFKVGDRDFALFSPNDGTRIMELPSCRDIGGEGDEQSSRAGFRAADYYVPCYVEREHEDLEGKVRRQRIHEPSAEALGDQTRSYRRRDAATGLWTDLQVPDRQVSPVLFCSFGFVAGSVPGDDGSLKVQFLDLTDAHKGVLRRDERFGYIVLPESIDLRRAVGMTDFGDSPGEKWSSHVTIDVQQRFDLWTGKQVP